MIGRTQVREGGTSGKRERMEVRLAFLFLVVELPDDSLPPRTGTGSDSVCFQPSSD